MYEQISRILVDSFNVPADLLRPEATLDDLGLDSLETVELSLMLSELGVSVTDDELVAIQRLDAITDLALKRAAA